MQKNIVTISVYLLSIGGYLLVVSSGLSGVSPLIYFGPPILAICSHFINKLYTVVARVVLPITFGMFAMGLLSVGYENLVGSDFYMVKNFGITENSEFSFKAEDNFFSALTTLFSVVSAFLLWKGLTDFDRLKEALNEEAEKIWAIVFLTSYLREDTSTAENLQNINATNNICQAFWDYISIATSVGNKDSREEGLKRLKSSDTLIDFCVTETKRIIVKKDDENDRIALEEIMKNLSSLVSIRSKRRVCMDTSMPPFILGAILVMSISVLLPFFGSGVNSFGINHVYVFMLSSIHMFIFMTLLDLSAPFDGYFSIQLDAFVDAGKRISKLIETRKVVKQA